MHSSNSANLPHKGTLCGPSMDDARGGKCNSLQVLQTLSGFFYARSPTVVLGCIADAHALMSSFCTILSI